MSQTATTRLAVVLTSINHIVRSFVSSTVLADLLQEKVPVDNMADGGQSPVRFPRFEVSTV